MGQTRNMIDGWNSPGADCTLTVGSLAAVASTHKPWGCFPFNSQLGTVPNDKSAADGPCPPSFEQALGQLETIVHQLEEGEIGLAEALGHYEQGIKLFKQCYGLLERAERRIEILSGVDAAGNAITQPLADEASLSLEEKAQARGRRRSRQAESANPAPPQLPEASIDESGSLF
jgi:exodeoxyribonuclease VII small subunit